jgi:hypothetical protein
MKPAPTTHRRLTKIGVPRHKDGNRLGLLARKKLFLADLRRVLFR